MKAFAVLAAVSALSSQVSAHYIFQQLTVGGVKGAVYQNIRKNTNYNSPITDLTSNDLRCNEGGVPGSASGTASIAAGSSFTFSTDTAVYHNGPIAIYMAKAPTTAASFDGSGQVWFKIWQQGPTFNPVTWPLRSDYTATIPSSLPSGEYLLRIEQLGLHNPYPAGTPQFYIGCAQVSVTGGGSGSPGPLVSIPGHVKGTESGYTVNIYNNFNSYTFLGPAVWTGGSGSTNPQPTTTAGNTNPQPTTTLRTTTRGGNTQPTTTTRAQTTTSSTPSTGGAPLYGQCGGIGWTGPTTCAQGKCTKNGDYYSQCTL